MTGRPFARLASSLLASLVGLAIAMAAGDADACGSCRGPAGPGATLTAPWERWGVALSQATRFVQGAWNDRQRYIPQGSGSAHRAVDLTFAAGFRPHERWEIAAVLPYGREALSAPGFHSERAAFGDVTLRAKWDVISEPMPGVESVGPWPSLGLSVAVRAPTASVDRAIGGSASGASSGTAGSSATSQGLGTWELALSADVRRTIGSKLQAGLIAEGAVRLADDAIGIARQLGPRALGRLVLLYMPPSITHTYTLGVFTDVAWEGSIAYGGTLVTGTAQRLWGVGAMAGMKLVPSGLRAGLAIVVNPPVDGIGANALGAVSLAASLGYAR